MSDLTLSDVRAAKGARGLDVGQLPRGRRAADPRLRPGAGRGAEDRAGQQVLDVACGAGNVAIPAAIAGADVTAVDIAPACSSGAPTERLGSRRRRSTGSRATPRRCRSQDASFDVVTSAVGVMFCPSHERAAAELVRVCRPGGSIGLIAWTPEGLIGSMFGVLGSIAPAPPAGACPAALGHRAVRERPARRPASTSCTPSAGRSSSRASPPTRSST